MIGAIGPLRSHHPGTSSVYRCLVAPAPGDRYFWMSEALESRLRRRTGESAPVLLCIASSAGGIEALSHILDLLPSDLPLAVIVVQHIAPARLSNLPEILGWHTAMDVKPVQQGDAIRQGVIYVAPPDHHVLVRQGDRLALTQTQQIRHSRPSADLTLVSAAKHYSRPVIGVVLTGRGIDGSAGIQAVHRYGGVVFAQDPESAKFRSMPDSAIDTGDVDHILSLEDMVTKIVSIVSRGTQP